MSMFSDKRTLWIGCSLMRNLSHEHTLCLACFLLSTLYDEHAFLWANFLMSKLSDKHTLLWACSLMSMFSESSWVSNWASNWASKRALDKLVPNGRTDKQRFLPWALKIVLQCFRRDQSLAQMKNHVLFRNEVIKPIKQLITVATWTSW